MVTYQEAITDVGRGWKNLIRTAYTYLPAGGVIEQVKEKFGLLRIYYHYDRPKYIRRATWESKYKQYSKLLIDLANQSRVVCEECGNPGRLITETGWWRVRCSTHQEVNVHD